MNNEEFAVRLSILEVEVKNMKDKIGDLHESVKEHKDLTLGIKEKLDRQNGAIPHMSDDIRSIMASLNNHISEETGDLKKVMEVLQGCEHQRHRLCEINDKQQVDSESKVKIKIMWSVMAALGTALLAVLIKMLLG